jgi:hypothetical protein
MKVSFASFGLKEVGSGLARPQSRPNNPIELTAHSAGFLEVHGVVACGPQLTGSVRYSSKVENTTDSPLLEPYM